MDKSEDYEYSSCAYCTKRKSNHLVTTDFMYNELGRNNVERQTQYQKLVVDQIVEESYKRSVWGSDYKRYKEQEKIDRKLKREIPI